MIRREWVGGLVAASTVLLLTGCYRETTAVEPEASPSTQVAGIVDSDSDNNNNSGNITVIGSNDDSNIVIINGKRIYPNAKGEYKVDENTTTVYSSSGNPVTRSLTQQASSNDVHRLQVHTDFGSITAVPSASGDQLTVTAKVSLDDSRLSSAARKRFIAGFTLVIDKKGDHVSPRVIAPKGFPQHMGFTVAYEVAVPKMVALNLSSENGSITVRDTHTEDAVNAESDFGSVTVSQAGNEVTAKSQNGSVTVTCAPGTVNVEAQSDFGSVSVTGDARTVKASSQNGSVTVEGAKSALWVQAECDFGSVHLRDCNGDITGRSQNGTVTFAGSPKKLDLKSEFGSVIATVSDSDALTEADLHSDNGSVKIELPDDAKVAFDASTENGSIHLDNAPSSVEKDEDGMQKTYREALNDGDVPIHLSTEFGSVTIRVK